MLTNPKVGQEVIYTSPSRNIHYQRAIVVMVDGAWVIRLKEEGTTYFVELDDDITHVRGS